MTDITDVEDPFENYTDETPEEKRAREETEVILSTDDQAFVDKLVDKLMLFCDELSGHPLYEYQRPFARRVFESLIINDGATLTALFSRQSGKSETVANVMATAMILLPRLAKLFPDHLSKFKEGVWVGAFAPVEDQAQNLYGRIVQRLTSDTATEIMNDPEINDKVIGKGREMKLKNCGSLVRRTTCHPRATIEGRSYHIILVDECQGADDVVINKSVTPMGAAYNATMVFTGTPTYTKNVFYRTIQMNKRLANTGTKRQHHFDADWKAAAKANPNYAKFVKRELLRLGEDSDEFKLSYRLIWMLDKGMFTTADVLDELGDKSMEIQHAWARSPVVVGIDPARKQDSTIVTVVWVGWDNPDQFGFYEHRVLNWLDLTGLDWETQYFRIADFLRNYNVMAIGVDTGGVGDAVASRLKVLLPTVGINAEVVELGSQQSDQSKRWKHLMNLLDRKKIGWPAHAKTRRLKTYRRFRQQMEDLEKEFKGPYVMAQAPDEAHAHDDYADSLAMACVLTQGDFEMAEVEVTENFLLRR